MSKIKICGLKREEDILYANDLMPDYIGFVFAGEKRKISFDQARLLKRKLNKRISAIGVFVNEDIDNVASLANDNTIDIIQLHGDEDNEYIDKLRSKTDKKIIKSVRVKSKDDIINSKNINSDYLLFDSFTDKMYGGSGVSFDHSLLPENKRNFFLAGGIKEEDIKNIVENMNPYCIDVSSSVETDGFKDYEKMKKIVKKVKMYSEGEIYE